MVFSGRYHYRTSTWGLRGNLSRSEEDDLWLRGNLSDAEEDHLFTLAGLSFVSFVWPHAFQHFFLLLVSSYGQNHSDDINSILFHEFT